MGKMSRLFTNLLVFVFATSLLFNGNIFAQNEELTFPKIKCDFSIYNKTDDSINCKYIITKTNQTDIKLKCALIDEESSDGEGKKFAECHNPKKRHYALEPEFFEAGKFKFIVNTSDPPPPPPPKKEEVIEFFHPKVSPPQIREAPPNFGPPEKVGDERYDSKIFGLINAPNKADYATQIGLQHNETSVRLLLNVSSLNSTELKILDEKGAVEVVKHNQIQMEVPFEKIEELLNFEIINKIMPATNAIQESNLSVLSLFNTTKIINATIAKEQGFSGKNVKVAVLDLGFDTNNTNIKKNIKEIVSFRHDFGEKFLPVNSASGTEHGTAVAEIITSIAPDAQLFLYSVANELEFLEAINYARIQEVDIVTASLGWINYPADGTSLITTGVEDLIENNITFITSSGNYAQSHWEGYFVDENNNRWHDFSKDEELKLDEFLSFNVTKEQKDSKSPLWVSMHWYSPTNKNYDFDLILVDPKNKTVPDFSNDQTKGGPFIENIRHTPLIEGIYDISVRYNGQDHPDAILEIFSSTHGLEYSNSTGSIPVPKDAKGALVVGAMSNPNNPEIQPFTSKGPTNNGIRVPIFLAPDNVTTTAYGHPELGTSFASPHVAGVVALLLERNPEYNPKNVTTKLTEYAKSIDNEDNKMVNAGFISEIVPAWLRQTLVKFVDITNPTTDEIKLTLDYYVKEGTIAGPQRHGQLKDSDGSIKEKYQSACEKINCSNITGFISANQERAPGGFDLLQQSLHGGEISNQGKKVTVREISNPDEIWNGKLTKYLPNPMEVNSEKEWKLGVNEGGDSTPVERYIKINYTGISHPKKIDCSNNDIHDYYFTSYKYHKEYLLKNRDSLTVKIYKFNYTSPLEKLENCFYDYLELGKEYKKNKEILTKPTDKPEKCSAWDRETVTKNYDLLILCSKDDVGISVRAITNKASDIKDAQTDVLEMLKIIENKK